MGAIAELQVDALSTIPVIWFKVPSMHKLEKYRYTILGGYR